MRSSELKTTDAPQVGQEIISNTVREFHFLELGGNAEICSNA